MPRKIEVTLPEHWDRFLTELDARLKNTVSLTCIGGFVIEAVHKIPRRTVDIDFLSAEPDSAVEQLEALSGEDSDLAKKYRVHLQHVTIADPPEEYEKRLLELRLSYRNLRLFIVDVYDLMLLKLSRNAMVDREDVRALAQTLRLDYEVLIRRYEEEMKPWIPNEERHSLTLEIWKDYFPN